MHIIVSTDLIISNTIISKYANSLNTNLNGHDDQNDLNHYELVTRFPAALNDLP